MERSFILRKRTASSLSVRLALITLCWRSWTRNDLLSLTILLGVALGLRAWHISHTEVIARDSISYMRYAHQLQHHPWKEVIPKEEHHPGYPFLILAMSGPGATFTPGQTGWPCN